MSILSELGTKIGTELNQKQDKLVSGTSIKTINGTSVLGSGDITIEGGSGAVTTTDALNATAAATAGAVGTYVFAKRTTLSSVTEFGSDVAGSSLYPYSGNSNLISSISLSGTWKCMGYSSISYYNGSYSWTLWLRIS